MLCEALDPLGIPILGVLRRAEAVRIPDRHLGLVPAAERREGARRSLDALGAVVARSIDLQGILRLARSAGSLDAEPWSPDVPEEELPERVRIAVAAGPSFSFLYRENLELLEGTGAEVVTFDPTSDEDLPEGTDVLYLGGGFPETYAEALSANGPLRGRVSAFAAEGRPVVAECGGLLYLVRELDGHPMCGVIDASARMTDHLTLGYREARSLAASPLAEEAAAVRGHEFHYSAVEPGVDRVRFAWELAGRGPEGFIWGGVHASYLHTHWAATPELPRRLVRAASQAKPTKPGAEPGAEPAGVGA
jgi:cobyrinic acid a,c-diamide synthase